jgi:hypothetical protein
VSGASIQTENRTYRIESFWIFNGPLSFGDEHVQFEHFFGGHCRTVVFY